MFNRLRVCFVLAVDLASGLNRCHRGAIVSAVHDRATAAGVVRDSTGGAVAGAVVIVRTDSGGEQQTVTGPDGRFTIAAAVGRRVTLIVRAGGFAEKRADRHARAREIDIVLVAGDAARRPSPSRRRAASSGWATCRRASAF